MRAYALAILCIFAVTAGCDDDPPVATDTAQDTTAETAQDTADTAVAETVADTADDSANTPDEVAIFDEGPDIPPDVTLDTANPDEGPDLPPAADNCLEQFACLATACATSEAADLATCFSGANAGCGVTTDGTDTESDFAVALAGCAATNECVPDGSGDMYDCLLDNCVVESAVCHTADAFGADDSCFDLRVCTRVDCKPGLTGLPDYDCLRTCATQYDKGAVEGYLNLQYCLDANCADAADIEVCYTQMQSNPLCSSYAANCPSL